MALTTRSNMATGFSMTPRHRWMFQRLAECFSISESFVEQSLRTDESATLLRSFLVTPGSSPPRLFAFYQPRQVRGETQGEWTVPKVPGENVLFLTTGGSGTESLQGKAAYFLRLHKGYEPVPLDVAGCDDKVIFGELGSTSGKTMLHDLETVLGTLYRPIIHTLSTVSAPDEQMHFWGAASRDQRTDFLTDMDKFSGALGETIKSMVGGVDLRKPDPRIEQMAMALQASGADAKKSVGSATGLRRTAKTTPKLSNTTTSCSQSGARPLRRILPNPKRRKTEGAAVMGVALPRNPRKSLRHMIGMTGPGPSSSTGGGACSG